MLFATRYSSAYLLSLDRLGVLVDPLVRVVLALRRCLVVLGLLADLMVREDLAALCYLAHQGNLVLQPLPVVHVLPVDLVVREDLLLLVVPVVLLHLVVRCCLVARWVLLDPVLQESLWDPEVRQSQLDL